MLLYCQQQTYQKKGAQNTVNTVIYYFSATGNSLTTAKLLADRLGGCTLVPIASLRGDAEVFVDGTVDAVGFVFPIYFSDMPYAMRNFVSRLRFAGKPYIFSVCTSRGHFGDIAKRLHALLAQKGQKLSCSAHVQMPGNSRISTPEENALTLAAQRSAVNEVAALLRTRPQQDYTADAPLPETPVHTAANIRGLEAEESCIGCGICAEVCPMDNIRVENGRAAIGQNCTVCLACFHWCPVEAIWMKDGEPEMRRRFKYHHPDVTLQDILRQKQR